MGFETLGLEAAAVGQLTPGVRARIAHALGKPTTCSLAENDAGTPPR